MQNPFSIFIVEDDLFYGKLLSYHLSLNPDYTIHVFPTAKECLQKLHLKPNVVTIDYSLPDMNGKQLYQEIKKTNPEIPAIVISSQEEVKVAVSLLKMGIVDYIVKDETTPEQLWKSILRIRETQELKTEVEELKQQLSEKFSFQNSIIGQSKQLTTVFGLIEKACKSNINVSITGETGTGKEVVARAVHYNSDRKKNKFVAVNTTAIPKELIESELFGHEKGAFTGAIARKIGKFEEAQGGTIFLDEIAELDISLQSKLLRVLQEREIVRVGGNDVVKLDVRLIVATHKNLQKEVQEGKFREDLFYRIIGLPIQLPALRERGGDILLLAKHFIQSFANENKMTKLQLAEDAKHKLLQHHYPGNVRELKSVIELAVVMSEDNEIKASDISFTNSQNASINYAAIKTLKEHTAQIVQIALATNQNNVVKAAQQLDVGKSTIYKMLQQGEVSFQ